jgi:hypothetical protein
MLASTNGDSSMLAMLIKCGADVNYQAKNGDTALTRSVAIGTCALIFMCYNAFDALNNPRPHPFDY